MRSRVSELRAEFEQQLAALVDIPSVSMEPDRQGEMERCVIAATQLLEAAGARTYRVETGGLPLLVGSLVGDPAWPTVALYAHLDVQPATPEGWTSEPFRMTRDGDRYLGRGATDDKGPLLTQLFGARLAIEQGVPLNYLFLWESEEEIGSPGFATGLKSVLAGDPASGRPALRAGSAVASDTIWVGAGRPTISYGLRGLAGLTVRLRTGTRDVHSGTTGGAARNPVGELAQLVAECCDARTGRVKIPGFYDDVRRPSTAERAALARAGFTTRAFKRAHGLLSLRFREDAAAMNAIMSAPTLEVHGLVGGYSGPGVKTIVPAAAELKLSMRLVPDQRPARMFRLVRDFIRRRVPDAIVEREGFLEPYVADLEGREAEAAVEAIRETFGKRPALVREGGSIGAVVTMRDSMRVPVMLLGLSLPEHGYHSINESYDWGQAAGGMEMFCRYFGKLAGRREVSR